MVEGKNQVSVLQRFASVYCYRKELRIVDLAVVIKVYVFEDLLELCLWDFHFHHCRLDLRHA